MTTKTANIIFVIIFFTIGVILAILVSFWLSKDIIDIPQMEIKTEVPLNNPPVDQRYDESIGK